MINIILYLTITLYIYFSQMFWYYQPFLHNIQQIS